MYDASQIRNALRLGAGPQLFIPPESQIALTASNCQQLLTFLSCCSAKLERQTSKLASVAVRNYAECDCRCFHLLLRTGECPNHCCARTRSGFCKRRRAAR